MRCWPSLSGTKIAVNTTQGAVMVRMAEKVHGITGEKNGVQEVRETLELVRDRMAFTDPDYQET